MRLAHKSTQTFVRSSYSCRALSSLPAQAYLKEDEVIDRVLKVVKTIRYCPPDVSVKSTYAKDLNFDMLLRKELAGKLSAEFCVPLAEKDTEKMLISVESTVQYLIKHSKAR